MVIWHQGDQIGQSFAYRVVVYLRHFLTTEAAQIFGILFSTVKLCKNFDKKWTFWAFFSKTHLVTLASLFTGFRIIGEEVGFNGS
jgi:bacteriorhodopsin